MLQTTSVTFASSDPVYLDVSEAVGQVHHSMIDLFQSLVDAVADGSDQEVSDDLNNHDGIVDVRPAFGP